MLDWVRPEEAEQIFRTTKQEKRRLEAALQGYLVLTDMPAASDSDAGQDRVREDYAAYIRRRIRPAAQALAEQGETQALRTLARSGLMPEAVRREITLRFARQGDTAAWLVLAGEEGDGAGIPARQEAALPSAQAAAQERCREVNAAEAGTALADMDKYGAGNHERAKRILGALRGELYTLFPFLDCVIAALPFRALDADSGAAQRSIGSDGSFLYYDSAFIVQADRADHAKLLRLYLHVLLHCVYRHWEQREGADPCVEALIEAECDRRSVCRRRLGAHDPAPADDHSLWPDLMHASAQMQDTLRRKWEMLSLLGGGPGTGGAGTLLGIGTRPGEESLRIGRFGQSRSDYRHFLSRFAVMREEARLDLESFDYIYYALGMERFGDLPLIEPLEYKEGHKLEELVIAIDTSGSCSAEMLRRFLEESCTILERKENFFEEMKVYFIQCDCTIHDVRLIRNAADWKHYCDDLQIRGRSGTDFTPVFRYVEKLREERALTNLKCLLYFTDGEGVYPRKAPDYETAFVFVRNDPVREKVPDWAIRLYADSMGDDDEH